MMYFFGLALLLASSSCSHFFSNSNNVRVGLHPNVNQDAVYLRTFHDSTRKSEVYSNFETKFQVSATYLSPKFRRSFDRRMSMIFQESPFSIGEAGKRTGFFVSIFSPGPHKVDINNRNHWNVYLKKNNKKLYPMVARHLTDKERWKPFLAISTNGRGSSSSCLIHLPRFQSLKVY